MTRLRGPALAGAALLAAGTAAAQESGEDMGVGVLHPVEGAGVTYDYCTGCHSERIIAQQGQTREGWEKLLTWMVEEQGMAPLEEPERTQILDYLSTHYNTDRPNFPR